MKKFTPEQLKDILTKHKLWIENKEGGERANLRDAILRNADLSSADLRNADLRNADLRNADLRDAILRNADLSSADLSSANLRNADLSSADLRDANLRNADLSSADLRDAVLRNAILRNADLSSADLSSADLRNADLRGADLGFNCYFGDSCGAPVYQACRGFGSRDATLTLLAQGEEEEWVFFTGCFGGTRTELEAAVAGKHGKTKEQENYLRAIEYLWQTAKAHAGNE